MRRTPILQAAQSQFRLRPLLALLGVMSLLSALRVTLAEVPPARELSHLALGVLLILAVVALAPAPWQWTGDARRLAPLPRGLFQALLWNAAWLGLLMLAVSPLRRAPQQPDRFANPVRAYLVREAPIGAVGPRVPGAVVRLMPLVLLAGWLMAKFQASAADRTEAMAGRRTLEATAREAQEQALKAQLDPHVLYNALGGISELIRQDPGRAEEAVLSLAELYRKLTALGRQAEVGLGEERALVADYLAMEQLRLGGRLKVAWDWPEALNALRVPPLLVQPLVENAIKHGLAPRREGGEVRLWAGTVGPELRIRVADQGVPLAPGWSPGTGLANLTQRLALLGGGNRFELRQEGAWTVAELVLADRP
jgi:signal transduction histidine kinase